jgi:hypothetical protein
MAAGIPVLSDKGRDALKNMSVNITARCRSVLVQVDGKRSLDDIRSQLKGLEGLEEAITKLVTEKYIDLERDCKSTVKEIAEKILGTKSPSIIRKIDEMHAKYGEACWDHLEDLEKAARLFYGEGLATKLRSEIEKILDDVRK